MAIYGERRKLTRPALLAGSLVVILVVTGAIFAFTRLRGTSSPETQRRLIAQEVQQMIEGLDVLAISHYTDDVVQNGQILLADEYRAARDNLQQIRQRFERIQPYLDPQRAAEVEAALIKLQTTVENKQPPADVQQQVERLMELLREVTGCC